MTATTTTHEQQFAKALDDMSLSLYDQKVWKERRAKHEDVGIDFAYYDMQCEVFEKLYNETPDLFQNYQWINDDSGMPLWVRPGVNWVPQHELDDEYD